MQTSLIIKTGCPNTHDPYLTAYPCCKATHLFGCLVSGNAMATMCFINFITLLDGSQPFFQHYADYAGPFRDCRGKHTHLKLACTPEGMSYSVSHPLHAHFISLHYASTALRQFLPRKPITIQSYFINLLDPETCLLLQFPTAPLGHIADHDRTISVSNHDLKTSIQNDGKNGYHYQDNGNEEDDDFVTRRPSQSHLHGYAHLNEIEYPLSTYIDNAPGFRLLPSNVSEEAVMRNSLMAPMLDSVWGACCWTVEGEGVYTQEAWCKLGRKHERDVVVPGAGFVA